MQLQLANVSEDRQTPTHSSLTLKDASTNADQIRRWFGKWPDANLGIVTGKDSGLAVLDVDDKDDRKSTL